MTEATRPWGRVAASPEPCLCPSQWTQPLLQPHLAGIRGMPRNLHTGTGPGVGGPEDKEPGDRTQAHHTVIRAWHLPRGALEPCAHSTYRGSRRSRWARKAWESRGSLGRMMS